MLHQTQGRERVVLAVPFGCRFHLLLSRFQLPLPRLVRRHSAVFSGGCETLSTPCCARNCDVCSSAML